MPLAHRVLIDHLRNLHRAACPTCVPEPPNALSPGACRVLFEEGTEAPGSSPLNREKRAGTYVCAACNTPLFASTRKYDSGTGWPSFWQALPGAVATKPDHTLALARVEYHCAHCGGHQGHVFDDGPAPSGQRYCNNGLALRFIPEGEALPPPRSVPPIPPEGA
jgi:peptide-methionine (R)-S-oxide reductase